MRTQPQAETKLSRVEMTSECSRTLEIQRKKTEQQEPGLGWMSFGKEGR